MEQIAEKITEGFIKELPEQSNFFTSEDLLFSGIPVFVVKTLEKTVASKIGANMNLPHSEWVETDTSKVEAAWRNFVEVSKEHIRIPAEKLKDLLKNAVERCLKLAVQPRQSVPEFIFKKPEEIDLETLKSRVSNLYVNRPLGVALLRYMEKKGLRELELEEARNLVRKIDQKLCENYHPLNWAQVLKPVFQLAGPFVHSDLLRIFFQDKGKSKIARKFDLLDKEVSETEFIEIMSSPDLLDVEGYEDAQPHLFTQAVEEEREMPAPSSIDEDETEAEPEDSRNEKESVPEIESAEEIPEKKEEESVEALTLQTKVEKAVEAEQDDELETEEENIADLFTGIKKKQETKDEPFSAEIDDETENQLSLVEPEEEHVEDKEEENVTLLNKFMFDEDESDEFNDEDESDELDDEDEEEEERKDEQEPREKQDPTSIYKEMNLVQENRNRAERMADPFDEDEPEEETDEEKPEPYQELSYKIIEREGESSEESEQEEIQPERDIEETGEDEEGNGDKEELPMWRSFLERDDIETESSYEYDEDSEEEIEEEEGFIEEPIYDLTATEEEPEEKIKDVSRWLEDEKDRFVKEIFRNSEMAYEQALIEIMDFNDWKSASHYLEREVFSRNKIDVYDEAAVDFTDRLHSYFIENKS